MGIGKRNLAWNRDSALRSPVEHQRLVTDFLEGVQSGSDDQRAGKLFGGLHNSKERGLGNRDEHIGL